MVAADWRPRMKNSVGQKCAWWEVINPWWIDTTNRKAGLRIASHGWQIVRSQEFRLPSWRLLMLTRRNNSTYAAFHFAFWIIVFIFATIVHKKIVNRMFSVVNMVMCLKFCWISMCDFASVAGLSCVIENEFMWWIILCYLVTFSEQSWRIFAE